MDLIDLWTNFLPIANVIFGIVFVVVIYSTAAGQGLSNYSVKKILPRLIIVAVGVNVSFYICAFVVDIINIVAVGLPNLIFANALDMASNTNSAVSELQGALGGILGIVLIICFAGVALVAVIVTVLALAARQIILSALVVISPIAIVCAVLPATQKWFDKWLKTFIQLLAIYPMFMLVWAATRWFQSYGADALVANNILNFIIKTVCTIIPAVAIYPLLKSSSGAMGAITGAINKSPLGTQGALGKAASDRDSLRQLRMRGGVNRAGQALGNRVGNLAARTAGQNETELEPNTVGYRQRKQERDDLQAQLDLRAESEARLRESGADDATVARTMRRWDQAHGNFDAVRTRSRMEYLNDRIEGDMRNVPENEEIRARNIERDKTRDRRRARFGGNAFGRLTGQRYEQKKSIVESAAAGDQRKAMADQVLRLQTAGKLDNLTGSSEQSLKAAAGAAAAVDKDFADLINGYKTIIQDRIADAARAGQTDSTKVIMDIYNNSNELYVKQAAAAVMNTQGDPGGNALVKMWNDAVAAGDQKLMVGLRNQILGSDLAGFMTSKSPAAVEALKGFKAADASFYANADNLKGIKMGDWSNATAASIEQLRNNNQAYFNEIQQRMNADYALNPNAYKENSIRNWSLSLPGS